jgi:sugar O-acyltransferase (sialic acid O-acetyltransferase NeuD family)
VENLLIIGTGGHSSVAIDIAIRLRFKILGLVDDYLPKNMVRNSYPILGNTEELEKLCKEYQCLNVFIAVGNNVERFKIYNRIKEINKINFVNLIHPNAILGFKSVISIGTMVWAGSVIGPFSEIKKFSILNTLSSLDHHSIMEDFSSLGPKSCTGGFVKINKFSSINIGSILVDKITIGTNCIIGANSLVLKDINDNQIVYGSPAIYIRENK